MQHKPAANSQQPTASQDVGCWVNVRREGGRDLTANSTSVWIHGGAIFTSPVFLAKPEQKSNKHTFLFFSLCVIWWMWVSVEHRQHIHSQLSRCWKGLDSTGHAGSKFSFSLLDERNCHGRPLVFAFCGSTVPTGQTDNPVCNCQVLRARPVWSAKCLWRLIGEITKTWSHWTCWHLDTEIIGARGSQRRKTLIEGPDLHSDAQKVKNSTSTTATHRKRWNQLQQSRAKEIPQSSRLSSV